MQIIQHCLRKNPDERYTSALEIKRDLEYCRAAAEGITRTHLRTLFRQARQPRIAIPSLLVLLIAVALVSWRIHHRFRVRWAREEALPQISQFVEEGNVAAAYTLATEAERFIPDDPMLVKAWPHISWSSSIITRPPGASVFRRDYNSLNSDRITAPAPSPNSRDSS